MHLTIKNSNFKAFFKKWEYLLTAMYMQLNKQLRDCDTQTLSDNKP
jgi:hypothetical protein